MCVVSVRDSRIPLAGLSIPWVALPVTLRTTHPLPGTARGLPPSLPTRSAALVVTTESLYPSASAQEHGMDVGQEQNHWIRPDGPMAGPGVGMEGDMSAPTPDMFFPHGSMDGNANHVNPASYYTSSRAMHGYRAAPSEYC